MTHLRLVQAARIDDAPVDDLRDDGDMDEGEYALTPRQARIVEVHAGAFADGTYDDIEQWADEPVGHKSDTQVLNLLPELTWGQNKVWRRQLARAFDDLSADISDARSPLPTCTGEEMALHLVLERARAMHLDGEADHMIEDLPEHPDDRDWESAFEGLFEDHDVLALFEGPAPALQNEFLVPAKWFEPFDPAAARAPARGFRR